MAMNLSFHTKTVTTELSNGIRRYEFAFLYLDNSTVKRLSRALKTTIGSRSQAGTNMRQIDNFINGEFVASSVGRRFEKRSPVDNRVIASIAELRQSVH